MSDRTFAIRVILGVLVALVVPACGDDDGMTMTPSPDSGTPTGDSGPPADAGAAMASWDLESNLTVNGVRLDEGIRSAIAQHYDFESGPGLTITLTTASDYWPNVLYDAREGFLRDDQTSTGRPTAPARPYWLFGCALSITGVRAIADGPRACRFRTPGRTRVPRARPARPGPGACPQVLHRPTAAQPRPQPPPVLAQAATQRLPGVARERAKTVRVPH